VESGATLRENHLQVLTEFMDISARFIANPSSFRFKNEEIITMTTKLEGVLSK
jgi:ATP phosphoribosyltransferase